MTQAYPGQNVTKCLKNKAQKSPARSGRNLDGRIPPLRQIDAQDSLHQLLTFRKGTVIPAGQSSAGASGHRNTWRIAYTIEPIREWIFRQQG